MATLGGNTLIYHELQNGFRQMNVPVHLVEGILPGFTLATSRKYAISATEAHPNALANRILANYILTEAVSPKSGSEVTPLPADREQKPNIDQRGQYPAK